MKTRLTCEWYCSFEKSPTRLVNAMLSVRFGFHGVPLRRRRIVVMTSSSRVMNLSMRFMSYINVLFLVSLFFFHYAKTWKDVLQRYLSIYDWSISSSMLVIPTYLKWLFVMTHSPFTHKSQTLKTRCFYCGIKSLRKPLVFDRDLFLRDWAWLLS